MLDGKIAKKVADRLIDIVREARRPDASPSMYAPSSVWTEIDDKNRRICENVSLVMVAAITGTVTKKGLEAAEALDEVSGEDDHLLARSLPEFRR